jgi:2',3'-cyclic-nucleotide 2'-phosphodiesterase (5'-nucleotidase family)
MIDGMNLMAYDAMGLGPLDLELGPDVLKQRIAESKFPVLSANVTLVDGGELLARSYVIRAIGGHNVAIIGVTGEMGAESTTGTRALYNVLKADDVLTKIVAEVTKQADIIIVLSTQGLEEDQRLSSLVPGIDVIVGGVTRTPMAEGWHNETTGTWVYQAGAQGEWIGRRRLHLDSTGKVTENKDELIYLTPDYADDAELRAFLDQYKAQ